MGHSNLPPSSAKIWGAPNGCTGWPLVNAMYPDETRSEPALDGTACHEVAEAMVRSRAGSVSPIPEVGTMIDGRMITQEMHEAATLYADTVKDEMLAASVFGGAHLGIEAKVQARIVHPTESYGTVDTFVYNAERSHLFVGDLKYGYGIVEVFENWQLINYAAGICDELGLDDPYMSITFCIVQPRAYHRQGPVRTWQTTLGEIMGYINILHENAEKALGPYATTNAGDHCKHCRGRATCEAAISAGYQAMEISGSVMPVNMSEEELAIMYGTFVQGQKQLEYITVAIEEEIKNRIRSGKGVPGYGLGTTRGRKAWAKDKGDILMLGNMLGVDLRKNEPVTPAQAIKLGVSAEVVAEYSETHAGLKLEKQDINKARAVFARKQ